MAVVVSGGEVLSTGSAPSAAGPGGGFSRGLILYSGRAQDYAALYRAQPNVRMVIRFLGRNIAQLGLKGFRRVSENERQPLPKGHALAEWIKAPTPINPNAVTRYQWIRALVEDLALYDQTLHLKMRNPANGRLSAVRIPPANFVPMGESLLWPDFFRVYGIGNQFRDFAPADVIYFAGHNPTDSRSGCSPIEALRRILAEDAASGEYREQFWQNAGRSSGYIERPLEAPKWTTEARDRFLGDFRANETGAGPGAGGTAILEEGMTYKDSGFSAKDSEYLGARLLSRAEVAAQYFIHPVFVGIMEGVNYSTVKEAHRGLYSDTLGPWLEDLSTGLEAQVVPEFADVDDVYLDFNIEAKLAGSFEEQAAAMSTATGAPWLVRDEARAKLNLPPLPDGQGQQIVTPLNVLVGGLASPRDTAPPIVTPAPGTMGRPTSGAKASLAPALRGWEAKHAEIMAGFFTRQKAAVLSRLGAGHELATAFESDRWNAELRTDLFALALGMAEEVGGDLAADHGGTFDPARVTAYLETNARIAAEGVNSTTLAALGEAWSGVPRSGAASRSAKSELTQALHAAGLVDPELDDPEPPAPDPFAPAKAVFDTAIAARAVQIATSRATTIGQFARSESAAQVGLRTKTWVASGAANSRHADLDGETVPMGETFSNGAQWPGDPSLGVDQTAGCLCSLDFGQ